MKVLRLVKKRNFMKHIHTFGKWTRVNEERQMLAVDTGSSGYSSDSSAAEPASAGLAGTSGTGGAGSTGLKPHFQYSVNPSAQRVILRNDTQGSNAEFNVPAGPLAQVLDGMSKLGWNPIDLSKVEFAANCALYHPGGAVVGVQKIYGKSVKGETPSAPDGKGGNYNEIPFMSIDPIYDGTGKVVTNVPADAPRNGVLYGGAEYDPKKGATGLGVWSIAPTSKWNGTGYFAMGSGPILILGGVLNKYLNPASKNFKEYRAGVGIDAAGNIHWAIINESSTFYEIAKVMESYGCKNAIYCDATTSQAWLDGAVTGATSQSVGPIMIAMKKEEASGR